MPPITIVKRVNYIIYSTVRLVEVSYSVHCYTDNNWHPYFVNENLWRYGHDNCAVWELLPLAVMAGSELACSITLAERFGLVYLANMEKLFFDSWSSIVRIIVIGICAYVGLVVMLRVAGNRTLSQLNAFDLIVTVALGSTLATVILNKDISLVDGLLALGLLISLQMVISTLSIKSKSFRRVIRTEPFLLFYKGTLKML